MLNSNLSGSLDDIAEAIRVNCNRLDPHHLRNMVFAGLASAAGHYERDISAYLNLPDCNFLCRMCQKNLELGSRECRKSKLLRGTDEHLSPTFEFSLYRKYILASNYLTIACIFRTASGRRRSAR